MLSVMREAHAPHTPCRVEPRSGPPYTALATSPAFLSLLAGSAFLLAGGVTASLKLGPCSPLEQGLIVFDRPQNVFILVKHSDLSLRNVHG